MMSTTQPFRIRRSAAFHALLWSVLLAATVAEAQTPLGPGSERPLTTKPSALQTDPAPVKPSGPTRLIPGQVLPDDEALRSMAVPDDVLEMVARMGASEWAVRDKATRELAKSQVSDLVLLAVMLDPALTIEQKSRLIGVLSRRILDAPRGAVGIRMRGNIQGAVVVEAVIPGMPGEDFLRAGDRITGIDGRKIATSEDLTSVVQGRRPGDVLVFEVVRRMVDEKGLNQLDADGRPLTERIKLTFPLGSVEQLDSTGNVSTSSMVTKGRTSLVQSIRSRFGLEVIDIRTPSMVAEEQSFLRRSSELHPSVQWLLVQLKLEEEGQTVFTGEVNRVLDQHQRSLLREIADPRKSEAERAWLERVLERFRALRPGV
jgi:hypothetical protein